MVRPEHTRYRALVLLVAASGLLSAQGRLVLDGPVVLQDGQTVVFSSNLTPQGELVHTSDLFAVGSNGVRRLTTLPPTLPPYDPNVRGFDATPDGSHLAIATDAAVIAVDAATGAQRVLFPSGHVDFPRFTPDGRTILMSVHPFTGHEWFPYLYSVGVDGGAGVKLVRGATDGRHPVANDGTIVFTSPGPADDITTTDAPRDVYTMSPDGTAIRGPASPASLPTASASCSSRRFRPGRQAHSLPRYGLSIPTASNCGPCPSTPTLKSSRSPAMAHWWLGTSRGKST
jgi:hypothetical protein